MDNSAPPLLGVLRAVDMPQAIGMLAPLPLTLIQAPTGCRQTAADVYRLAGAGGKLSERN